MLTRFNLRAAESDAQINGILHQFLEDATGEAWTASNSQTASTNRWFKNFPTETDLFTLTDLVAWSTPAAKEAIEKLAAQVVYITGQTEPVIHLELAPSVFAEVQAAWQLEVTKFQKKHLASCKPGVPKAIKQAPNPISSPCKENENENGNTHESSSYSSPPCAATQELNSGDRKVRRVPASLQSLSSTPCPSPPPSPSYLLSFAHPSPSLSHADGRGNRRAGL